MDKLTIYDETLKSRSNEKVVILSRSWTWPTKQHTFRLCTVRNSGYRYKISYFNKGGSKLITKYTNPEVFAYLQMESLTHAERTTFISMSACADTFELALTMLDNLGCLKINKSYLINFKNE